VNTLENAVSGDRVVVTKIHGEGAVRRRIMDMGVTKGAEIFIHKIAPLGDPLEIHVRGSAISLRKEDAKLIEVAQ
jgi:ferrous iron transport protein A